MAATGGQGVDVVLNSLSGDAIEAGLSVLGPGGRFLEIGKRGIWARRNARACARTSGTPSSTGPTSPA